MVGGPLRVPALSQNGGQGTREVTGYSGSKEGTESWAPLLPSALSGHDWCLAGLPHRDHHVGRSVEAGIRIYSPDRLRSRYRAELSIL